MRRGFCPAGFLPGAGNRSRASCLFGKTEARRGRAPEINRVRARHGNETNPVRDLLTAGALLASLAAIRPQTAGLTGKRPKSQRSRAPAFRAFLCVGDAPGLLPGGFPPGRREQEVGFLPARENRSSAWACTQKEPRACVAGQRCKPGARLAHRRCAGVRDTGRKETRCANCPAQARTRNQPRACEMQGKKRQGARFARRSRATCPPQAPRR